MRIYSGGYIGILFVFLGTVLIIFLAVQQYERIGQRTHATAEQAGVESGGERAVLYPIDRALDAKAVLEARDRAMIGE